MSAAVKLVQDHWSEKAKNPPKLCSWTDAPTVLEWVHRAISGNPKQSWSQYAVKKYVKTGDQGVAEGLVLGCGNGVLDRELRKLRAIERIDAYDIAPGAIEEATRLTAKAGFGGITYHVADLNHVELPAGKYDVAFCSSAVHHIERLEHLFAQVRRALKPGGYFIILEYVGPSQFQFPPKVVRIINDLLQILPPELRVRSDDGAVKDSFEAPTREYMNCVDPSEAIRSDEILPLMGQFFELVEVKPYGGTINHMLLHAIVHNFDEAKPEGRALLSLLMYLESLLIREGVLATDFASIVARNTRTAAPPPRPWPRLLRGLRRWAGRSTPA